ncbi:MAG: hypothetical protein KF833_16500 [Verrucomicrobiae bacterium]|nr:hypothetical protein [Verrucomicrobiae bacterium]
MNAQPRFPRSREAFPLPLCTSVLRPLPSVLRLPSSVLGPAGLALAWLACTGPAPDAAAFAIHRIEPTAAGPWRVLHDADPDGYFILYAGSSIDAISQPQSMALGVPGLGSLPAAEGHVTRFFRVRRVPLSTPLDLDDDGIDDVFELRHPAALNPLDPSDALEDFDGDGASNLAEYRAGTDPLTGTGGWTFHVVDDPLPGSTTRFRTLTEAVAHLNAHLPADRAGRVLIETTRPQEVEVLELNGDVELAAAPGYEGRIVLQGPASAPMVLRSGAALNLAGWSIESPAGLRVESARRLTWTSNRSPAATFVLGPGTAHATRLAGPHGGGASSLLVGKSVFTGPLRLTWFGGGGAAASLGLTENTAPAIEASVHGLFGGVAEFRGNLTTDLALSFDALAAARIVVANQANLDRLAFSGTAQANPTLSFSGIFAANLGLELAGIGSVFASLETVTSQTVTLDVGASHAEIDARDLTADRIVLNLASPAGVTPRLRHSLRNVTARGGIQVNAIEARDGSLDLSLALVNASQLELASRAATRLQLDEGVTLSGQLRASVTSQTLDLEALDARVEGGLSIQAGGIGAGLQVFWQGGAVRGRADIESAIGATVGVTIDGTVFDPGGALAIVRGDGGPTLQDAFLLPSRASIMPAPTASPGAGAILLRNLTSAPGSVLVAETHSAVTLENCQFQGATQLPVVILEEVQGPIRVADCTFTGQGLAISDAGAEVTLERVQIQHAGGVAPAVGISGSSALVDRLAILGTPLTSLALNLSGSARIHQSQLGPGGITVGSGTIDFEDVHAEGFATLTGGRIMARNSQLGSVISLLGQAVLGFDGGALGGVMILDFTESGGLLHDPVSLGANPEEVYSPIDFDNDPLHCADYPPPQTRPDTGACVRPGVPPPR